jgi:Domain of unknown function (DUF4184)
MPFTVSHIAAVLPGYRPLSRAGIFTAAVIGSMVPDFGMLAPVSIARWQTHSFEALFTFCLPVGLATYWLTLLLIRPAVLEILPDGAYVRLRAAPPPASIRRLRAWLYAAAALLLGAATHLIWDAFTHENARGVRMFPLLSDYGPEMAGHHLQFYLWLQHGSSLAGLLVVVLALGLWLRRAPAPLEPLARRIAPRERALWIAAYLLPSLLVIAWGFWHPWPGGRSALESGSILATIAVDTMRAALLSLALVSALILTRLAA